MRIHLHLGMPKTGTSSLQAALLKTYGSAQPQKIWYPIPERMGHGHADLGWRAMGHGDIRPEPTILIDLARRARDAGCEDLLLNSEVFTHAMLGAGRATVAALARYGEPVPIVTLTALGGRTNSIWQEIVKSLGGGAFENSYDQVAASCVELPFVTCVAEAFPDRPVPVICVDRSDDPGMLFRRFSEASGIALTPELGDAAAQNRSLYRLEADLMAGLARSFGDRVGPEEEYRYAQYRMLRLFESADWRATGPQTRITYPHAWTNQMAVRAAAAVAGLKSLEAAGRIRILGDVERLDDVTRPYKWPGVDIHRGSPMTAASIVFVPQPTGTRLEEVLSCAWNQSLADFELLIAVGHCDAETRAAARAVAARDPRVRVLESPQTADANALRHAALGEARGAFIAYLDEADIWLPHHLACLNDVLQDAEFAHGLQAVEMMSGNILVQPCDLSNPDLRHFMSGTETRRFGLGLVGHRLDAYRRLPGGWHSLSKDTLWPDVAMWQQFLREPWCRARTVGRPTAISIDAYVRSVLQPEGSAARMAQWRAKRADPAFVAELDRIALASFNTQWTAGQMAKWNSEEALKKQPAAAAAKAEADQAEACRKLDAEQAEARRKLDTELAEMRRKIDADGKALAKARAQLGRVGAVLQHKRARYAKIKKSRSWRWTRPFRRLARKLAPRRDG